MKHLVWVCLLLTACGASEKKGLEFGKDDKGQSGNKCAANLEPIPFYQDGLTPLNDISLLPAGAYRVIRLEAFLQEVGGDDSKIYYTELQRGAEEMLVKTNCVTPLPKDVFLQVEFPNLRQFTLGATPSYVAGSHHALGDGGSLRISKNASQTVVNGSIQPSLARWSHWVFYRLSETQYEARFYSADIASGRNFNKRMSIQFSFTPAVVTP